MQPRGAAARRRRACLHAGICIYMSCHVHAWQVGGAAARRRRAARSGRRPVGGLHRVEPRGHARRRRRLGAQRRGNRRRVLRVLASRETDGPFFCLATALPRFGRVLLRHRRPLRRWQQPSLSRWGAGARSVLAEAGEVAARFGAAIVCACQSIWTAGSRARPGQKTTSIECVGYDKLLGRWDLRGAAAACGCAENSRRMHGDAHGCRLGGRRSRARAVY